MPAQSNGPSVPLGKERGSSRGGVRAEAAAALLGDHVRRVRSTRYPSEVPMGRPPGPGMTGRRSEIGAPPPSVEQLPIAPDLCDGTLPSFHGDAIPSVGDRNRLDVQARKSIL